MINTYEVGDVAHLSALFSDSSGTPLDPDTCSLRLKNRSGDLTYAFGADVEMVRDGAGGYHVDVPITVSGMWLYRWESTGNGAAAAEGRLYVRASHFA